MPRSKPKEHSNVWGEDMSFKLRLEKSDMEQLIKLVGLYNKNDIGKVKEMLAQVERVLSQYAEMKRVLDHKPRPTAILAEVKPVNRISKNLLSLIDNLKTARGYIFGGMMMSISEVKDNMRHETEESIDISIEEKSIFEAEDNIRTAIKDLIQYTEGAIKYLKDKKSHHGTKKEATRNMTAILFSMYNYYCPPDDRGNFSGMEEFTIIAFKAINEKPPGRKILEEVYNETREKIYIPQNYPIGKTLYSVVYF